MPRITPSGENFGLRSIRSFEEATSTRVGAMTAKKFLQLVDAKDPKAIELYVQLLAAKLTT